MHFAGQHVLCTEQFDRRSLIELFQEAEAMGAYVKSSHPDRPLEEKILATLFFEPSTRTRFSFETAMLRLGGSVISNSAMLTNSSIVKGETLSDTGQMVSRFADVIVMRHPKSGAVAELAKGSLVPVINAGDGAADHPTQGLLDLYTIHKEKGEIDGLKIGLIGDLKYSRVFHAQAKFLSNFEVTLYLISPAELKMPPEIVDFLKKRSIEIVESNSLKEVLGELDVISTSRIQEERFSDRNEFVRLRRAFVFNREVMRGAKKEAILLSPLPRVDEIDPEIDNDPRCKYFDQVSNGVAVRMALLDLLLS